MNVRHVIRTALLGTLPALLELARRAVSASCKSGDPEGDELKRLLDACVVGAYRLRLRERLEAQGA